MIDPSLPIIFTAAASIVASVVGIITMFKVEKVHKATNSMKDALVKAAHAEGKQEQRDEDRKKRGSSGTVTHD